MIGIPACFRKYDIIKIVNTALIYLTAPAFYYIVPFTFTKPKTNARATFRSLEAKLLHCTCGILGFHFGKEK